MSNFDAEFLLVADHEKFVTAEREKWEILRENLRDAMSNGSVACELIADRISTSRFFHPNFIVLGDW